VHATPLMSPAFHILCCWLWTLGSLDIDCMVLPAHPCDPGHSLFDKASCGAAAWDVERFASLPVCP
jgi:hypothetical protein